MVDARVRPVESVADLLDSILNNTSRPAIIVVCSTRAKFLEQLSAGLSARIREAQTEASSSDELFQGLEAREQHPLLTKTIGVLANSRRVHLVFCPSLEHYRAYLSSLQLPQPATDQTVAAARGTTNIIIIDLVALHYMSSEFSAQGLSRTLALTIEAAARTASSVVLYECEDAVVIRNPNRGHRLWNLHLPILSGPSRPEEGRQLSARLVAQRWFRFEDDTATMGV